MNESTETAGAGSPRGLRTVPIHVSLTRPILMAGADVNVDLNTPALGAAYSFQPVYKNIGGADRHGRECPVYKFRRGDLYDNFQRLFDQLWNAAGP